MLHAIKISIFQVAMKDRCGVCLRTDNEEEGFGTWYECMRRNCKQWYHANCISKEEAAAAKTSRRGAPWWCPMCKLTLKVAQKPKAVKKLVKKTANKSLIKNTKK